MPDNTKTAKTVVYPAVHIYAVVRVKVINVEAAPDNPVDACIQAQKMVNLDSLLNTGESRLFDHVQEVEYDDGEALFFLVDKPGDPGYEHSEWVDGDALEKRDQEEAGHDSQRRQPGA